MNILRLLSGLVARAFGACPKRRCRPEGKNPHRYGWYSVENDKALGHYYCTLAVAGTMMGGTVKVTNVTTSPTGGLAGWPDAKYMGEVVPPNEGGIEGIAGWPEFYMGENYTSFGKPWTPPWSRKLAG